MISLGRRAVALSRRWAACARTGGINGQVSAGVRTWIPSRVPFFVPTCQASAVTLLGVWVSDGVSGHGGAWFGACAQAVVDRPAVPVTCSQVVKRCCISVR